MTLQSLERSARATCDGRARDTRRLVRVQTQDIAGERWLPVVGYGGRYEVSDQGRVRVLFTKVGPLNPPRMIGLKRRKGTGYRRVTLYNSDGARRDLFVHRVVLDAFVGPRPEGLVCRHLNGPPDCRLVNLKWDTQKANAADTLDHGTRCRGERQGSAKLTEANVREIRRTWVNGETQRAFALRFGVGLTTIKRVITGAHWGWFEPENIPAIDGRKRVALVEKAGFAKLTASAVVEIRNAYCANERIADLARQYNVSTKTIHMIVTRRTWRTVL